MVKTHATKFSAASVAKGSVVLSKAIEKNFALEAEVSRLRHHVSVLSKRLHATTREKEILESIISTVGEMNRGKPSRDEVAEEVEIKDATEEVAEIREEIRPACEEVAEGISVAELDDEADDFEPHVAERGMEVAKGYNKYAQDIELYDQKESIQVPMEIDSDRKETTISEEMGRVEKGIMDLVRVVPSSLPEREQQLERLRLFQEEVRALKERSSKKIEEGKKNELGSSGDEDAIIGGIIVEGGASKKAKKKKNKKKRKAKGTEEEKDHFDPTW